jgi:FHA domain-containing protein
VQPPPAQQGPARAVAPQAATVPPAAGAAAARPAVPAPSSASASAHPADLQALMDELLAGLAVSGLRLPQAVTPELMGRIGRLLREATQGTLDLLIARAMMKREIGSAVTMIAPRQNNPLKFSPDVGVALTHLFAPPTPGFMTPEQSMRDAYEDLRSHEIGFMAGMRAALAGVLKRFDPEVLERRLKEKSMMDAMLPMNRRARLWNLYTELYREIAAEAMDDFNALFGREFVRAYEEQIARLNQEK